MKNAIFLIPVILLSAACNQMTKNEHPDTDDFFLEWEFLGNDLSARTFHSVFTLENRGDRSLEDRGWELFFNHPGLGVLPGSETGHVKIEHINGDLVRIVPGDGFLLEPGERVNIDFSKRGWLIKEVEAPLGPYMVFLDSAGNDLAALALTNYTVKPFPPLEEVFPPASSIPLPDAGWIHEQNLLNTSAEAGASRKIIPAPLEMIWEEGKVVLGEDLMIHFTGELEKEAAYLARMMEKVIGGCVTLMNSDTWGPNIIHLAVAGRGELEKEEYHLTVLPESGIQVTGGDAAGVFYGIQSLLALIPVEYWQQPSSGISIEALTIHDSPAFSYRGMHLDIARNYNAPEAIKKLVSIMAFYKMNKLHLHLTEDEAWRLEIPSLPELTGVGGFRGHTRTSKDHLIPAYGSGPNPDPGQGYGSGFLTREEFIDILRFADDHHMEVIPEINLPGHARAAIYAMEARYDRLMKEGKREEAKKYRLIDPRDASEYNSAQNFDDNVVCVCQEAPYLFFQTVLDDVIGMYEDAGLQLKVIHTGGDEVPHGAWEKSPVCRAFLEEHPEIGGASGLQAYFGGRLFEILRERGMVMAGWEEIAMEKLEGGGWKPNPEFTGGGMLPYVWNSIGDNLDLGYRLANGGYPVILCNVNHYYFDLAYNHHPAEPGLYWGGFVDTRRAFEFNPFDIFKSMLADPYGNPYDPATDFAGMERLKPEARKNIVGLQGQLWSETIKGGEMLEYYYLPKMIPLAERAWSGEAGWGSIADPKTLMKALNEDWTAFAGTIALQEMPRLDRIFGGFNYRLPPPGAIIQEGVLYASAGFPGLTIRYTTDGSIPGTSATLYSGPVEVSGTVSLRTFDTRGRGSRISLAEEPSPTDAG